MSAETRGAALPVTGMLARRAAKNVARQPSLAVPAIFFPLFFVALNTAALGRTIHLPGFPPVDSFLDFMLATTIVQGVLFGAMTGGADLALDIETGFFDRLLASPVPRLSILLGRLGGSAMLGVMQALIFVSVLVAFGASIKGGIAAVAVLVLMGVLLAIGIGGLAMAMALRTGSSEAVQGAFPLFFILMFMSSAFFPRQLMSGWYQAVAGVNPMSHLIEGARELVIEGFHLDAVLRVVGICLAIIVVTLTLAIRALFRRLERAA